MDLFFVLSAYLITNLLLREKAKIGRIDIRSFYIRRALRIWPLYFFFLACALLLSRWQLPADRLHFVHIAGLLFFFGNWVIAYFPVQGFVVPLWSLAVEEQFYLVWPIILRTATRSRIFAWVGGILLADSLWRAGLTRSGSPHEMIFFTTFGRLDGIAVGALIAAYFNTERPRFTNRFRYSLLAGALALWICAVRFGDPLSDPPSQVRNLLAFPLIVLSCGAIVIAISGIERGWLASSLRSRLLVYLGRISYGLYVFHVFAIWLIYRLEIQKALYESRLRLVHNSPFWEQLVIALLAFAITLACAAVSYHFLEMPFLRIKDRYAVLVSRPADAPLG